MTFTIEVVYIVFFYTHIWILTYFPVSQNFLRKSLLKFVFSNFWWRQHGKMDPHSTQPDRERLDTLFLYLLKSTPQRKPPHFPPPSARHPPSPPTGSYRRRHFPTTRTLTTRSLRSSDYLERRVSHQVQGTLDQSLRLRVRGQL